MSYLFLEYPKCNTCRNAKKWLDEHKITYEDRHIIDRNPSVEELTEWIKRSKLPLKNFFNTSGLVYKEMKLKDKHACDERSGTDRFAGFGRQIDQAPFADQ